MQANAGNADSPVEILPSKLTQKNTGLSRTELVSLTRKQRWLYEHEISIDDKVAGEVVSEAEDAVKATLIFADEHAGTAACISPGGLLLTCAHCVEEGEVELDEARESTTGQAKRRFKWLLAFDGRAVKAEVLESTIDLRRDLALLRVVGIQQAPSSAASAAASSTLRTSSSDTTATSAPTSALSSLSLHEPSPSLLHSISISSSPPSYRTPLICIGQPGPIDLETSPNDPERLTGFDILHISTGTFRGYAKDQDKQDNSDIGALKHDCWTYWGHSGAPLVALEGSKRGRKGGAKGLIGVHSSWDDTTGMRRGVGWEAVVAFLTGMGFGKLVEARVEDEQPIKSGEAEREQRKKEIEVVALTQGSEG